MDPLSFASNTEMRVWIGDIEYSGLIKDDFRYSAEDPEGGDAPAVVLETVIEARLPEVTGKPCTVEWYVLGERMRGYQGTVVWSRVIGERTTVHAATSGENLRRTPIGEGPADDREYASERPDVALYETISGVGYSGANIPPVTTPPFTRQGQARIQWADYASGVAQAIREECNLALCDSPLNVAGGYVPGSEVPGETVWTFTEGKDFDFGELSVEPREGAPGERYSHVVVVSDINGTKTQIAHAAIDNGAVEVRKNTPYIISYEDTDTEGAWTKAYREAQRLSSRDVELSFPVIYPPFFVERLDVVRVMGREVAAEKITEREYVIRLLSDDVGRKDGELSGVGRQVATRVTERSKPPVFYPSGVTRPLFGKDYASRLYFEKSVPWVRFDPARGLVFYPEIAAEEGVSVTYDPAKGIVIDRV